MSDRVHSAHERAGLVADGLTGAHRRAPGLAELQREITKANRTGQSFVLAFVDVDGLKAVNDSQGHAAGDNLLREVVRTIRGAFREYDLIVRYGGDEFVCGLLDVSLPDVVRRFEVIRTDLAATEHASFTVGLAELRANESLDGLIKRADAAMYQARKKRSDD